MKRALAILTQQGKSTLNMQDKRSFYSLKNDFHLTNITNSNKNTPVFRISNLLYQNILNNFLDIINT